MDRFFLSPLSSTGDLTLAGTEAHHLARVLRKRPGERVEVFDGQGRFAQAEIVEVGKKSVKLQVVQRGETPPPAVSVTLATAVPKGERFRWLVEKAVELGVDRLVPLITHRGVVKPGEGKRDKMEQAVVEASKQCGRNWLMALDEPTSWAAFLTRLIGDEAPALTLVAHPGGRPLAEVMRESSKLSRIVLAAGPEGGFTDEEIEQAHQAGAVLVDLGPSILRIETAGLALAACARLI